MSRVGSVHAPVWGRVMCVCITVGALALSAPVQAQTRDSSAPAGTPPPGARLVPRTDQMAAQEVLFLAYPDLLRQPLAFEFATVGTRQVITVREDAPAPAGRPPARPTLLTAEVEFTAGRELQRFTAVGPYVRNAQSAAFAAAVRDNPTWTDAEAQVWLRAAQAPSAADSRVLHDPVRWEALLGRATTTRAATWRARSADPAAPVRPSPAWEAEVDVRGRDGRAARYVFEFDPLTARVVAITRDGGR